MNPTPFKTASLILLYYFCYKGDVRTRFRLLRINKEQLADEERRFLTSIKVNLNSKAFGMLKPIANTKTGRRYAHKLRRGRVRDCMGYTTPMNTITFIEKYKCRYLELFILLTYLRTVQ